MIVQFVIICAIIQILYWYLTNYLFSRKLANSVTCPTIHPIFGNATLFVGSGDEIFRKFINLMTKYYNRKVGLWKGPYFTLYIVSAKDAEFILKDCGNKIDKGDDYRFFKTIIGNSSFLLPPGAKFKQHKKIIMPWFRTSNLKNLFGSFNEKADNLVENIRSKVGVEFNIQPIIAYSSIKSLAEILMGIEFTEDELNYLSEIIESLSMITMDKVNKIWLRNDIILSLVGLKSRERKYLDDVHEVIDGAISKAKNSEKQKKHFDVFVELLVNSKVDDGSPFPEEDIRNEIKTMLVAGHATSISSLCFVLSLLGIHQEVQEDLYREVETVLGDDWDGIVTYDHLTKFELMDRVLQEAWRLYPSGAVIGKRTTEDIEFDGIPVPKGTIVNLLPYVIHRNPDSYPNPDKFDPNNFLPENVKNRNPYSFLPFSAGNRACIGQKFTKFIQKVILAKIIKNFKIYSSVPEKDYQLFFEITMKRADGFPVRFQWRNTKNIK